MSTARTTRASQSVFRNYGWPDRMIFYTNAVFKIINSVKYTTLDYTTPHCCGSQPITRHIKPKNTCGDWIQVKPYKWSFFPDLDTRRSECSSCWYYLVLGYFIQSIKRNLVHTPAVCVCVCVYCMYFIWHSDYFSSIYSAKSNIEF